MAVVHSFLTLLIFSLTVRSQHVHYEPSWVQSVVASCTSKFSSYVKYQGPTDGSIWTAPPASPTGPWHTAVPSSSLGPWNSTYPSSSPGSWDSTFGSSPCPWTSGVPSSSPGPWNSPSISSYPGPWPSTSLSSSPGPTTSTISSSSASPSTSAIPSPSPSPLPANACAFWLEEIQHQGVAPFQSDPSYSVFRNVKDYGATGDGVTDDTAAINLAISTGDRCAPGSCNSTTTTPALVYFPAGTYVISSSIIDYYFTQLIGNPNCMPVLQATANFTGFGLIDGDLTVANGLAYGSTNIFWRQVRNFVLDMTDIPASSAATGIHWPTAQATSLQNLVFQMSEAAGTQHQGVFIESGSGGFMNDLVFYGGLYGGNWGNQQFTMRNLTFYNAVTAINQQWDWGWTYKGISINNCTVGLNMSSGGPAAQTVGSVTFFDSSISDTPVGILTAHDATSQPPTAGSLILENVALNNVPVAVQGPDGPALAGTTGSTTIAAWGEGNAYTPAGPQNFQGAVTPNTRPGSLVAGDVYYQRSKPQYETIPVEQFVSARTFGATGDGSTDDTAALQSAITTAATNNQILFLDYGVYKVLSTLYIPGGSKIVGESYPVIMGSGAFFSSATAPQPVVQIGRASETGSVELSDLIISTQGATAGAILVEHNLSSPPSSPSGLWDVHTRIGGFAGSGLQLAECPSTPTTITPPAPVNSECIAAFMSMHVTASASGLYLENNWFWTADHDVEDLLLSQITIYTGRGLLVESTSGTIWLYATAVEHHALYQYQFSETKNVVMGQIQTETAYYQPDPPAPIPFPFLSEYNDPIFPPECYAASGATFNYTSPLIPYGNSTGTNYSNPCDGFGLRILSSENLLVYGAGLYSFFNDYNTTCSNVGEGERCQTKNFVVDTVSEGGVAVYNLNTVGTTDMITLTTGVGEEVVAVFEDNLDGFVDTVALFRS